MKNHHARIGPFSFLYIALLAIPFASQNSFAETDIKPPNIVVFMVDDLGWNHIGIDAGTMGTHDPKYVTPNLVRLAAEGLSFTHAYAQPNCAPTRAAMLSGQYPARIYNDVYVVGSLNRNSKVGLSKRQAKFIGPKQSEDVAPEAVTIAEAMHKNGYATAHNGKYHIGGHEDQATMPENVGFDINLGGSSQGHLTSCFASDKNGKWKFRGVGLGHFDRFGDPYTQQYVDRHDLPAKLVGTPKHISDALGDALEETVAKLHAAGKPFYLQFHTYAVHGPVKARPDLKQAFAQHKPKMAEYLGFIAGVDENIGRLLSQLEDPNCDGDSLDSIANETLILFTSDNGGTHTNNLPLKGVKGMLTEGGIRVPMVARWPGTIPAGTVSNRKIHCLDYYPTCLQVAGNHWQPPSETHPLDGESFHRILFNSKTADVRGPIFYLFPGYLDSRARPSVVAIDDVEGKRYKLFYDYEANAWELYCLSDDQGEKKNLVDSEPQTAKLLSEKMQTWLTQKHATWKPKYPISKETGEPAGPPPLL